MILEQWLHKIEGLDRLWILTDLERNQYENSLIVNSSFGLHEIWLFDLKPCLQRLCTNEPKELATQHKILNICDQHIAQEKPNAKEFGLSLFLAYRSAINVYVSKSSPTINNVIQGTLPSKEHDLERFFRNWPTQ